MRLGFGDILVVLVLQWVQKRRAAKRKKVLMSWDPDRREGRWPAGARARQTPADLPERHRP